MGAQLTDNGKVARHEKRARRLRGSGQDTAEAAPGVGAVPGPDALPTAAAPSMADVASLTGALLKLPDSVVIVDEEGNVAWGNSSAERLFGRSLADDVGISGLSLVHPDDQELVLRSLTSIQDKDVGDPIEIRVESATGWRLVEIVGTPLRLSGKNHRPPLPARPDEAPAFRAGQRP